MNNYFRMLLSMGLYALVACNSAAQTYTNLQVSEFEKAIEAKNIQLLDVRTAEEYKSGHIKNALQADWNNSSQFAERTAALDKSKPVYIYCLSGGRSAAASKWLQKNGFTTYHLVGGINAWKQAEKQVEGIQAVTQLTVNAYEQLVQSAAVVLVDVGAVWCPPCKKMEPVLDSLSATQPKPFKLVKIDGANETNLCKRLTIEAFPTFIVYKNGKEVWRKQGIVSAEELIKVL